MTDEARRRGLYSVCVCLSAMCYFHVVVDIPDRRKEGRKEKKEGKTEGAASCLSIYSTIIKFYSVSICLSRG